MPSLIARCAALLRAPANEIAFALRSSLRWSRGTALLPNEDKARTFAAFPAAQRLGFEERTEELARDFDLTALREHSTIATWTSNLALLANLRALADGAAVPTSDDGVVRAVDVGSGDFHYATALHRFFARQGATEPRTVVLRGFEIDGHGVYRDGHSRRDHARAHAALAESGSGLVRYEVADALRLRLPEQDVVTLLFPFLTSYPLLRWGLPLSRFRPRRLVKRAIATVRPGGWLVVANQTGAEFARWRELLAGEPVELVRSVSFAADFGPGAERTADRIGSLWVRQLEGRNVGAAR